MPRCLLILLLAATPRLFAQQIISGTIRDRQNGQAVTAARITTSSSVTYSDLQGRFKLPVSDHDSLFTVHATFYQPETVRITDAAAYPVALSLQEQNLEEITVSALRSENKLLTTAGAVSLLAAPQISRNSPVALEPSLNQVPGVLMHTGSFNTNRITIRGIGSRSPYGTSKIKAYLDEIPLTSGDGETTLEDLSLLAISQIEVVRGPVSGSYGSGLGGAILLKSTPGTEPLKIKGNFLTASFGTNKTGLSLSGNRRRSSHLLVSDRLHSNGYRDNNRYDRLNLFSWNRFESEKAVFNLLFDLVDLKAFIPSSLDYETYLTSPTRAAASWAAVKGYEDSRKIRGAATWKQRWSNHFTTSATGVLASHRNLELRPFNLLQEKALTGSGRIAARYQKHTLKINSGIELFSETYLWKTFSNGKVQNENLLSDNLEKRFYGNLFVQGNWNPVQQLNVESSVNLNLTRYDYNDRFSADGNASGKRHFEPVVSPRVGISYLTGKKNALFMLVSHGFSAPTLEETLLPDGQVNPEIKPETGWNFETGARGKTFANRLFYDLSLFRMAVKNLLVARRTGEDAYVGVNAGKTSHAGLEFALRYLPPPGRWSTTWLVNGTLAHFRFKEFTEMGNNYAGNQLTGVPSVVLHAGVETRTPSGFEGNLHLRFTGRMPLNDANSVFSDAYSLTTLSAGKSFRLKSVGMRFNGGINNLFNQKYASMFLINAPAFGNTPPRYYYPGLPRNYFVTLAVEFTGP